MPVVYINWKKIPQAFIQSLFHRNKTTYILYSVWKFFLVIDFEILVEGHRYGKTLPPELVFPKSCFEKWHKMANFWGFMGFSRPF